MSSFAWKWAAGLLAVAAGLTVAAPADPPPAPKPATYSQSQKSREHLHRVAVAIHGYLDEHNDEFPKDIADAAGRPLLSWRVAILPYLDLEFLHAQFKLDEPWDGPNNRKLLAFMPGVFRSPAQLPKTTDTLIQAVSGTGAVFDPRAKVKLADVADGTSATLMLVESGPAVPWTKPADVAFNPDGKVPTFAGPYTDAVHVATADAATYRMTTKPDEDLLRVFVQRDDGQSLEFDRLKAAPAKPVTDAERKELEDRKAYALKRLREAAGYAEDRFKCEQELRKLGDVRQPDLEKIETLEELQEAVERINSQWSSDMHEYYRLIEHVRKVAPKAADRIELGRQQRVAKKESRDR
jgi:hypothetical protein